jgi:ribonuclease PH
MRSDGRLPDAIRPVRIHRGYLRAALGSVLIESGNTRVLCSASFEPQVPDFLAGTSKGWLTAEYDMLPGSTSPRRRRERGARPDGRSIEIQRLVGRALRNVLRLDRLGEQTVWIDCDVLDADGGTRTAAITGAFVALVDALTKSPLAPCIATLIADSVAAVSVGIVGGELLLDLEHREDCSADVDLNLVMTGSGQFIEVQGTGEKTTYSSTQLAAMLAMGRKGIEQLTEIQRSTLGDDWPVSRT